MSDLHIHDWPEFSVTEGGLPSRLAHCVDVLEDVRMYCNAHDIRVVILGGDLFHKRGVVFTLPYNMVVTVLARMKEDGLTVLAVDGNHDHANKSGTVHAVQALASAGLVEEVGPDGWANWHLEEDGGDDELLVSGFSYCDSKKTLAQRMEEAAKDVRGHYSGVPRIGVFHHGFTGARVGTALEYVVKEDLDPAVLDGHGFDYVFSGHYHAQQRIGPVNSRASYIGSPMEHVRGEGGQDKGFLVYDTKCPHTFQLIKLDRPKFMVLTQKTMEDEDPTKWGVNGNYVDVHYEELPDTWENTEKFLRRIGAAGVKAVPLRKKVTTKTSRLEVDPSLEPKAVMTLYLDHHKEKTKDMDRAELLRIGLSLFDKAQA